MYRYVIRCGICLVAAAAIGDAHAADRVLALSHGRQPVPSAWDDVQLRALLLRRENFNAHSFNLLMLQADVVGFEPATDHVVPFFDAEAEEGERLHLRTVEGADCLLQAFELKLAADGQPYLVLARRDIGDSYADPGRVHFTRFELRRNAEGVPGAPPVYFEAAQRWSSQALWCDVIDAMHSEAQPPTQ